MENPIEEHILRTYRKRAANYDFTANLYYTFGYREWAYRKMAVRALQLKVGDIILDLACGTGINFPLYQKQIGPEGRIIGVDITDAMLEQAQKKVASYGWNNVTLIQHDAATYKNPTPINAAISSYALSIFPAPEKVLIETAETLFPNGRLVILDLQIPPAWPTWLAIIAVALMKPFGLTDEWVEQRPWEAIQRTIRNLLSDVVVDEHYFGLTYIISGRKSDS
jgi:demethylmenaquinone methyltransferase/2-methoxy-6-polyprenyl-1,4-benzoquinol methylase